MSFTSWHREFSIQTIEIREPLLVSSLVYQCHNPIFTLGIFSDFGTQNEVAQVEPRWSERGPITLENPQNAAWDTFLEVWGGLTKFDQVWLGLTKFDWGLTETLTRPKAGLGWPPPNHWIDHIESFDLVLYGSKTDEKRESYEQNRENWSNT